MDFLNFLVPHEKKQRYCFFRGVLDSNFDFPPLTQSVLVIPKKWNQFEHNFLYKPICTIYPDVKISRHLTGSCNFHLTNMLGKQGTD